MSYATAFEKLFDRLPRDERGFLADSAEKALWEKCLDKVAVFFKEECPESCDSTLEVGFPDGSRARYANPRQWAFASYFSTAQFAGEDC